jgi:hypothetical protein
VVPVHLDGPDQTQKMFLSAGLPGRGKNDPNPNGRETMLRRSVFGEMKSTFSAELSVGCKAAGRVFSEERSKEGATHFGK